MDLHVEQFEASPSAGHVEPVEKPFFFLFAHSFELRWVYVLYQVGCVSKWVLLSSTWLHLIRKGWLQKKVKTRCWRVPPFEDNGPYENICILPRKSTMTTEEAVDDETERLGCIRSAAKVAPGLKACSYLFDGQGSCQSLLVWYTLTCLRWDLNGFYLGIWLICLVVVICFEFRKLALDLPIFLGPSGGLRCRCPESLIKSFGDKPCELLSIRRFRGQVIVLQRLLEGNLPGLLAVAPPAKNIIPCVFLKQYLVDGHLWSLASWTSPLVLQWIQPIAANDITSSKRYFFSSRRVERSFVC